MRLQLLLFAILSPASGALLAQPQPANYLAGNTVLIVRHAEKPAVGRELTPAGEARARAYASYFEPFHEDGRSFRVDSLFAGADSDSSVRPRLTLEPLSKATGLPLDLSVGTKEPEKLVLSLRTHAHGTYPLISWRHGQIPALLEAFGASPATLLPEGKWPDSTYDWVILLRFGPDGTLREQKLIHESLHVQ